MSGFGAGETIDGGVPFTEALSFGRRQMVDGRPGYRLRRIALTISRMISHDGACLWHMKALTISTMHAGASVFVAFLLPLASPRLHAQAPEPKVEKPTASATSTKRAQIAFSDVTIEEAAAVLSKEFDGVNFVVPADVASQKVSLKLRNVGLDQVLQAISFATGGAISTEEISEGIADERERDAGPRVSHRRADARSRGWR